LGQGLEQSCVFAEGQYTDPGGVAIELEKPDGFNAEGLLGLPEVVSAEVHEAVIRVGLHDLTAGAPAILRWLAENGHGYQHVTSERPDLETVFLTLTGRSLRDA